MKEETLKTSNEWQIIHPNPVVLDPDGWDRTNFQFSWFEELISLEEYCKRTLWSTVMVNKEKPMLITTNPPTHPPHSLTIGQETQSVEPVNNNTYLRKSKIIFSLEDIIDAVQYGFDYRVDSMNDGISVPVGNTLQWLMAKKKLRHVPDEFLKYKQE